MTKIVGIDLGTTPKKTVTRIAISGISMAAIALVARLITPQLGGSGWLATHLICLTLWSLYTTDCMSDITRKTKVNSTRETNNLEKGKQ